MGGGHPRHDTRHLLVGGRSPVHRVAAHAKLVALAVFATSVAATPRHAMWAFALDAALLATVAGVARIPIATLVRRALVVSPVLVVAVLVPFIGDGPRADVGPITVSADGLWAAWNIAAKATLGATASILLTATTPIPDLLEGMTRLRVPRPVVSIIAFMIRYLDLLAEQLHRMRQSMTARGHDPRWLWQARPIAAAAGTMFVRTYERGERIHYAMLARGFTGHMPDVDPRPVRAWQWLAACTPPSLAAGAALLAHAR